MQHASTCPNSRFDATLAGGRGKTGGEGSIVSCRRDGKFWTGTGTKGLIGARAALPSEVATGGLSLAAFALCRSWDWRSGKGEGFDDVDAALIWLRRLVAKICELADDRSGERALAWC